MSGHMRKSCVGIAYRDLNTKPTSHSTTLHLLYYLPPNRFKTTLSTRNLLTSPPCFFYYSTHDREPPWNFLFLLFPSFLLFLISSFFSRNFPREATLNELPSYLNLSVEIRFHNNFRTNPEALSSFEAWPLSAFSR